MISQALNKSADWLERRTHRWHSDMVSKVSVCSLLWAGCYCSALIVALSHLINKYRSHRLYLGCLCVILERLTSVLNTSVTVLLCAEIYYWDRSWINLHFSDLCWHLHQSCLNWSAVAVLAEMSGFDLHFGISRCNTHVTLYVPRV